ncbi:hypothetical protein D3C81_1688190 [compost metagenome]
MADVQRELHFARDHIRRPRNDLQPAGGGYQRISRFHSGPLQHRQHLRCTRERIPAQPHRRCSGMIGCTCYPGGVAPLADNRLYDPNLLPCLLQNDALLNMQLDIHPDVFSPGRIPPAPRRLFTVSPAFPGTQSAGLHRLI